MKKITSKLLLLMMTLVMTFSLAACGNSKDDQKESTTSGTSQTADNSDDSQGSAADNSDDSQGSAPYNSVSDYLNSDEVKETLSTLQKSLEGSGMNLDITAEGDKLIYTYTYEKLEKTDEIVSQIEEGIKAQDETFELIADGIKNSVNIDAATVVIKYVDCNGEEIFSKEYASK